MNHNAAAGTHPLLGRSIVADASRLVFEVQLRTTAPAFLGDHLVDQRPVLSSSAFTELVLAATPSAGVLRIEDLNIFQSLPLLDDEPYGLQCVGTASGSESYAFQIVSRGDEPVLHATATVRVLDPTTIARPGHLERALLHSRCPEALSVTAHYQECQQRGAGYVGLFQVITQLWRSDTEALARLELHPNLLPEAEHYLIHPTLLDGAPQVVWALLLTATRSSYMTVGYERLTRYQPPATHMWCYARLRSAAEALPVADICMFDDAGMVCIAIDGLHFRPLAPARSYTSASFSLSIAATFTAEPLEPALQFWLDTLQLPARITFAPYHQVFQQLLDPHSLFAQNRTGYHTVLVRFEDLQRTRSAVSAARREQLLSGQSRYTLPDGREIASLNTYETAYLYQELFVHRVYTRHGIVLPPDACVLDIGANIGLFSLFVAHQCPQARIYAFEPAPHTFDILRRNLELYGNEQARLFQYGVSDTCASLPFVFYPESSVFSGFYADSEQDRLSLRAAVRNALQQQDGSPALDLDALTDAWLTGRLASQTMVNEVRTLSQIIQQQHITHIDLLKIDAEKSEQAILRGIDAQHWPLIKQVVIEVHDQDGQTLAAVQDTLVQHGFQVVVDTEAMLEGAGLHTVYAIHPTRVVASGPLPPDQADAATIDDLAQALNRFTRQTTTSCLVCVCPPTAQALSQQQYLEDILADELRDNRAITLVRAAELAALYPVAQIDDPVAEREGHIPYTPTFFTALATMIARSLYHQRCPPIKVVVLDADGTLWNGVCAEDGPHGVRIDAPHRTLQALMLEQVAAGRLLCLVSKNDPADVLAVFDQHPAMLLRRQHLVAWRINWQAKSANIWALAQELGLGLDSFLFLDDNPLECAEVLAHCPEVLTLQLPADPDQISTFLRHLWPLDNYRATAEDSQRTRFYQQHLQREQVRRASRTFADFLAELQLVVDIRPLTTADLPRAAQLTQRTNQFHVAPRRCSASDIQASGNEGLVVQVQDRFGDYGLVGLILFTTDAETLLVDTFLLSCRVLGRGVEHRMLAYLGAVARQRGLSAVQVAYRPTDRNQPAHLFLDSIGGDVQPTPTESYDYRFPTDVAAAATFRPSPSTTITTAGLSDTPLPADTLAMRVPVSILQHIASELADPARIHAVIEAHHRRERPGSPASFLSPGTRLETMLADIWAEVLNLDRVGIQDNFFDLGGTSRLLAQVSSKIATTLGRSVSLLHLLKHPTISSLAASLQVEDTLPAARLEHDVQEHTRQQKAARQQRRQRNT